VVEVHLSNVHGREDFRQHMVTAGVCAGVISGLGFTSYELAILSLLRLGRQAVEVVPAPASAVEPARPERPHDRPERPERHERQDHPEVPLREARPELPSREGRPGEGETREARPSESELREGKRRRRGRRGGRGRRRGEERGPEGTREEVGEGGAGEARSDPGAIAARYANLKGAVVRRGLDVLAEDDASTQPPPPPRGGSVTFVDRPDPDEQTAAQHGGHEPAGEVLAIPAAERHAAAPPAGAHLGSAEAPVSDMEAESAGEPEGESASKPAGTKAPRRRAAGRRPGGVARGRRKKEGQ